MSKFTNHLRYKLLNFSGRATRKEFWISFLVLIVLTVSTLTLLAMDILLPEFLFIILFILFILICFAQIRRLHDTGLSGWYVLLKIIPFIGIIILVILLSSKGDMEENRFGPSPYKKPDNSFIWTIIGFIAIIFFLMMGALVNANGFLVNQYNNNGLTFLEEGKNEEALEAFNKAFVLYELERYNDSILECKLAIKLKPDFADAYLLMGHNFTVLKNYKEALDSYNMVLRYRPDDKDALNIKTSILMKLD